MIQRRTQTALYWQEQFVLTAKDVGYLYDLILDEGKPVATEVLALAVIDRNCRQEEDLILAELSKGEVYDPKDTFEVGTSIIFPALDYLVGRVVGTRPGTNPDYGEFVVVEVEFEDEDEVREFASQLQGEHSLNRTEGEGELPTEADLLGPAELYEQFGGAVKKELVAKLPKHPEFIRFREDWFLRDLLVRIEEGHLNIAEALIEIKAMPLTSADFLPDLDLPAEVSGEIQALSLNFALEVDGRFDNIGDGGRDIWYLRRLTPEKVAEPPARLQIEKAAFERADIADELLLIEREIDDEGSGEEVMGPSRPLYKTTIALTFPHWRCGTLPLTVRTRGLFPQSANHHTPIVLIDGQSGDKMQGWVVHEELFVYGLEDWYERYSLPVGAIIRLERTRDPRVVTVDYEPRRLKRQWVMVATVEAQSLTFELQKLPIACEYDEHLAVGEDSPAASDRMWTEVHDREESLLQTMVRVMPTLVKLSPQNTVHAKTIYSAVNILRRVAPGPIFALLSREACFVPMGGGYWTFEQALVRSRKV